MNLKISLTIITLLILLIAEILSYIDTYLWDMISDSPSYSERYYYKEKLTILFNTIGKIRTAFYIVFLISVIATFFTYICF